MSRSPSPASSLDFVHSDPSEDEYAPMRNRARARKPKKAAKPAAGKTGLKINLSALQRAAAAHPAEGQFDDEDEGDDGFLDRLGGRAIDLSDETLKADHAARPLWIDEAGNM